MIKTLKRKHQRGAAMVELAISMLLIIPIFLYVLFLDDLLKFRLDQQEAVYSTLWDYTIQNYDKKIPSEGSNTDNSGNGSAVQKYARNTFCDHEGSLDSNGNQFTNHGTDSSGNTIQGYPDCDSSGTADHHKGNLSAHQCWLGQGEQVTCTNPDKSVGVVGALSGGALGIDYAGKFQQGGMYTCEGREEVLNNIIPQKFFNDSFSKVDMAKKNWQAKGGDAAHDAANQADHTNAYVFGTSKFALLTDTWALTEVQKIDPEGSGMLQDRADYVYKNVPGFLSFAFKGMVYNFVAQAIGQQLMIVNPNTILNTNVSIHPTDPPGHKIQQDSGNPNFYDSPWQDWGSNPTQKTYQNRQNGYMGCQPGTIC